MLPSMSISAVPPSNPEYALLLVAYVVLLLDLNLTVSPASTDIVSPAALEVMDVQEPLFFLYSMVLVRLPKAFQQIVPDVRARNVR